MCCQCFNAKNEKCACENGYETNFNCNKHCAGVMGCETGGLASGTCQGKECK
jgi:hypothetical protein